MTNSAIEARDSEYMKLAIELAKQGRPHTKTNPCVGAVIVKDGIIVGKGYHIYYGSAHAEINALYDAKENAKGADLYVTLEPCSTSGKTQACTDAIIKNKISHVYIGVLDPNPKHAGAAVSILRAAGIKVTVGFNIVECARLIEDFTKYIKDKKPYVVMKIAQSMDGKIATASGESQWITSKKSRENVHHMRMKCDSILVGIGTVLSDDPQLTVRFDGNIEIPAEYAGRVPQPHRLILDSKCRLPLASRIVRSTAEGIAATTVFITNEADPKKIDKLKEYGVNIICMGDTLNVTEVLTKIGEMNIMRVLVEGGSQIFGSFIQSKLVDELHIFIAPMIIGGDSAKSSVGGEGLLKLADATRFTEYKLSKSDTDIWMKAKLTSYYKDVIAATSKFMNEDS